MQAGQVSPSERTIIRAFYIKDGFAGTRKPESFSTKTVSFLLSNSFKAFFFYIFLNSFCKRAFRGAASYADEHKE